MSWTNDGWTQDDSVNLGFPYRADAGVPIPFDLSKANSNWKLSEDANLGFPYLGSTGAPVKFDLNKANSIWKISPEINLGFPYIVAAERKKKSEFPVFTGFSVRGMGSGFHQQETEIPLDIQEEIRFTMPSQQEIRFYFKTDEAYSCN